MKETVPGTTQERVERLEQGFLTFLKLGHLFSERVDQLEKKLEQVESPKRLKEVPNASHLEQPA